MTRMTMIKGRSLLLTFAIFPGTLIWFFCLFLNIVERRGPARNASKLACVAGGLSYPILLSVLLIF
ncbi:MAG: hypothetical protein A3K07_02360 [Candidatus Doudnabacteria bacterium RIFCSPHIGHO2_01_43_10]|nr:MAG: hypothetical protein A3K07_02360 [Candidatus Doudnabacteria bacterium RIFCSPHIGHO2_01_43_10]